MSHLAVQAFHYLLFPSSHLVPRVWLFDSARVNNWHCYY